LPVVATVCMLLTADSAHEVCAGSSRTIFIFIACDFAGTVFRATAEVFSGTAVVVAAFCAVETSVGNSYAFVVVIRRCIADLFQPVAAYVVFVVFIKSVSALAFLYTIFLNAAQAFTVIVV